MSGIHAMEKMPATSEDLFNKLESLGIQTQTIDHAPVFTVAEAEKIKGQLEGADCKCLFLKNKKEQFFLLVMLADRRADLKALARILKVDRLGFASDDRLMEKLGITPGAVTPFAVMNDTGAEVRVLLDHDMMQFAHLNYHPLRNDQTTRIGRGDLLAFFKNTGHDPWILELPKL